MHTLDSSKREMKAFWSWQEFMHGFQFQNLLRVLVDYCCSSRLWRLICLRSEKTQISVMCTAAVVHIAYAFLIRARQHREMRPNRTEPHSHTHVNQQTACWWLLLGSKKENWKRGRKEYGICIWKAAAKRNCIISFAYSKKCSRVKQMKWLWYFSRNSSY